MERLIELFINTEDGEFYDRGGLLAAYDPAINAGELVRLTVQLCAGVPAFNSAGALLNPDTTFAGTLAAAETIIDNNFNWYDKGTLLENLTTGTAISELSVASEASPRPLGAVRLNADTVVNFCGWTATEGGYRLTLADNEFKPAQFTPAADFAQGAAVEVLEQPIIVSAQNDDSGRATGLFTGLLDAANPVYESMIEGHEDIPNCRIEFSIYQDGRAVFRARRYFDCLGAMAMNKGAAYVHSDSWREADSRYIKLVDWQAPPEYQFSEDGTNWHDQQQDADLYYHERRPGGQWGGAVKMKIGPTGAAAGFGTPTVAVESLPAGSNATATVTASGDDTAKVFSFSFGIPKGADGQSGTNGADGAAGADGVSSYTYVAYASDASGAGFSLTPSNALKYRAEIHTATAIETPDAEDFAGATWVKYIGDDGTGAGDMLKSVYDTNDDGIVDHAATADAVGATTAAQVADAVGKAHAHANKTTLDKLAETDGKLTFDGAEIGSGSGTVKSVNGQLPDESGNVTVETGGAVDESRLLPENPANGDIPCYSNEPPEGVNYNDANTVLLLQGSSDNTAAASTSERLNGIVTGEFPVQSDGSLLVTGSSNYITFNDADTRRVFSGEFTLETYIKTTQFTSSGARHDTNWCVVYRNDTSNVTNYQWLLLSDFYADAGKFGIWPYPQMSGETFPKTLVNAEFQHVAIDVYMVDGVRKFTMYRNGVPYHTGNYWSTTPADWSSGVSAAMRLFGEGPGGGDDYLSNASVMSLRVSNVARYKGVSFDPPADGKYLNPPAGYWGKINKSALVQNVNGQTPDSSGVVTLPEATTSAAGLMAAADKAAIAGLTTHGIYPNALAKSGAIDFNELIDHGFYFIGGDTPHLNYPETYQQTGGTLQVIRNGNYLTQTLILFEKNKSFNRSCFNATSGSSERTFSAWQRLLTDTEITESKTSPGYFKLPNGTIVQWGSFVITADPQTQEITLPVALSSIYSKQVSGSNSSLRIGIYGGTNGKITCYVEGSTSGTVDWMVIGK